MGNSVEAIAPIPTIQCAHPPCQESNRQENKFCDKCGTPLIKRYIWAIGDGIDSCQQGELLGERYLLIAPRILLDTKPGIPPHAPENIPKSLLPYLKLFPYRLHLPEIYGYIPSPQNQRGADIWLLEYGSVPLDNLGNLQYPNLLPELPQMWAGARDIRQLNWLEQMARLWQPLQNQGVVSSLLNPSLLRVNGATLQLLELQFDPYQVPTFRQLGKLWSQWIPTAAPSLAGFFPSLCHYLEQGKISRAEQLVSLLKEAIAQCGQFYQRTYQVYTCTDPGPSRDHNEDACYPPTKELHSISEGENLLTIVCDGIGGQDGGEIASQLAIETLVTEMTKFFSSSEESRSRNYTRVLTEAICTTNDLISQRNDEENRKERRRMGTTLVMSVASGHEMHLAHVGDSRIYLITPTSCHQVTVDDDLASREVRLGYLLYRDAIQYPNAGALVQALGMSHSVSLHPNVQRLVVDEDCVYLLCSDGLSDYDRVDQYWESEITPILRGQIDVAAAGNRLLEIGYRQNGHDNITIALIYCQVQPKENCEAIAITFPEIEVTVSPFSTGKMAYTDETLLEDPTPMSTQPTAIGNPPNVPEKKLPLWLILLGVVGLIGLGYGLTRSYFGGKSAPSHSVISSTSPTSEPLRAEDFIQIQNPVTLNNLVPQGAMIVPKNSILKVKQTPENTNNPNKFQLQVCTIRIRPRSENSISLEGKEGWIDAQTLKQVRFSPIPSDPSSSVPGACSALKPASPSTTATPVSP